MATNSAHSLHAVVIGGGPAGLAVSRLLMDAGRDHVVLEAGRIGESWRSRRWDSLRLSGPNYHHCLPGCPYAGDDPLGCMTKGEMVAYIESYACSFGPPVREGVAATAVDVGSDGRRFRVSTADGAYAADHVVIATGGNRVPRLPAAAGELPSNITQLTAQTYRNPRALPVGAVLVVGSGQSACQIAEELARQNRRVYLAVRRCWWWPAWYRGHDAFWWVVEQGLFTRPSTMENSPLAQISPQVTGLDGGRTLNLHTLARDGVVLLGHFVGARGGTLEFAPDLAENVAGADDQARKVVDGIDAFADAHGMADLAADDVRGNAALWSHEMGEPILELDLVAAGITTVIWAAGYRPDYDWVHLPAFDAAGYPRQESGVGAHPGLYFPALKLADSFPGAALDAAAISAAILVT